MASDPNQKKQNGNNHNSNHSNHTNNSNGSDDFKQKLRDIVNAANAIPDLTSSLQCVSINNVKQYVKHKIDELDEDQARSQYYSVSCINDVFSDDISQYILSFAGIHHVKAVNHQWLRWALQNEQRHFRALYSRITIRSSKGSTYNKKINKTWIIHPHRTRLNSVEVELGLNGPLKSMFGALDYSNDGDLLLVFRGTYLTQLKQSVIAKNLRVVGVESGVFLRSEMLNEYRFIGIQNGHDICLEIENFSMDFLNKYDGTSTHGVILVGRNSGLLMKNCKLNYEQSGVIVRDGARFEAIGCEFNGGCIGVAMSPLSKSVEITDCLFTNNGQITGEEDDIMLPAEEYGCIHLFDNYGDVREYGSIRKLVDLKCVGNTFRDNLCYPIVERSNGRGNEYFLYGTDSYILEKNSLDGFNGTYTAQGGNIKDANVLYHSQWGAMV